MISHMLFFFHIALSEHFNNACHKQVYIRKHTKMQMRQSMEINVFYNANSLYKLWEKLHTHLLVYVQYLMSIFELKLLKMMIYLVSFSPT